jgi:hypothetical protein
VDPQRQPWGHRFHSQLLFQCNHICRHVQDVSQKSSQKACTTINMNHNNLTKGVLFLAQRRSSLQFEKVGDNVCWKISKFLFWLGLWRRCLHLITIVCSWYWLSYMHLARSQHPMDSQETSHKL